MAIAVQPRMVRLSLKAIIDRISRNGCDVLSTDIFDTVVLRDLSLENERFDEASRRTATMFGLNPHELSVLRRTFHDLAYKAVAAERPLGDTSLAIICRTMATCIGGGPEIAAALHQIEVENDITHLRPNRKLIEIYKYIQSKGLRIVATSDTYYSADDISHILKSVIGDHPIVKIYTSSEIGTTKYSGGLFPVVVRRERVLPSRILHVGDNYEADVRQARAAGLQAFHLSSAFGLSGIGKMLYKASHQVASRIGL